jgi:Polysaccharide deacetylase
MSPRFVLFGCVVASIAAGVPACSRSTDSREGSAVRPDSVSRATVASSGEATQSPTPNELGRIPVFEYHLIVDKNGLYERTHDGFRRDLETMYARGYRPISIAEMIDRKIDLPAGQSPVVLVFDDASPSQFRYIEKNGQLEIDPNSAVGILTAFNKEHSDWRNRAVFCMLPAAQAGRSFFGDKGIEGQKTEWRYKKVKFLAEQGFELCNHTLYHARLDRAGNMVEEFIARGNMAIDSAVPGYKVRTLALPLGMWPKNRELAQRGSWRDAKGHTVSYANDAILEVAGGPSRSPYDPQFNPMSIPRVQVIGDSAVARTLTALEKHGQRYVSDGDPKTVARHVTTAAKD